MKLQTNKKDIYIAWIYAITLRMLGSANYIFENLTHAVYLQKKFKWWKINFIHTSSSKLQQLGKYSLLMY